MPTCFNVAGAVAQAIADAGITTDTNTTYTWGSTTDANGVVTHTVTGSDGSTYDIAACPTCTTTDANTTYTWASTTAADGVVTHTVTGSDGTTYDIAACPTCIDNDSANATHDGTDWLNETGTAIDAADVPANDVNGDAVDTAETYVVTASGWVPLGASGDIEWFTAGDTIPATAGNSVPAVLIDGTTVVLAPDDAIPANALGDWVVDDVSNRAVYFPPDCCPLTYDATAFPGGPPGAPNNPSESTYAWDSDGQTITHYWDPATQTWTAVIETKCGLGSEAFDLPADVTRLSDGRYLIRYESGSTVEFTTNAHESGSEAIVQPQFVVTTSNYAAGVGGVLQTGFRFTPANLSFGQGCEARWNLTMDMRDLDIDGTVLDVVAVVGSDWSGSIFDGNATPVTVLSFNSLPASYTQPNYGNSGNTGVSVNIPDAQNGDGVFYSHTYAGDSFFDQQNTALRLTLREPVQYTCDKAGNILSVTLADGTAGTAADIDILQENL